MKPRPVPTDSGVPKSPAVLLAGQTAHSWSSSPSAQPLSHSFPVRPEEQFQAQSPAKALVAHEASHSQQGTHQHWLRIINNPLNSPFSCGGREQGAALPPCGLARTPRGQPIPPPWEAEHAVEDRMTTDIPLISASTCPQEPQKAEEGFPTETLPSNIPVPQPVPRRQTSLWCCP